MFNFLKNLCVIVIVALLAAGQTAYADDLKEIQSITILCDKRLAVPLSQIASAFSQKSMISVSVVFGDSPEQKKKIEDGEAADVFITAEGWMLQQLKIRGLVDVYSIGVIATEDHIKYSAAVVAGENMTPARQFLEFIKSEEGADILRQNGLDVP
jgi:ABC-type molybdate transport system substrate-binding protein